MSEWINKLINGKDVEQMSHTLLMKVQMVIAYNHVAKLFETIY